VIAGFPAQAGHGLFIASLPPVGFKVGIDIPNQDEMIIII